MTAQGGAHRNSSTEPLCRGLFKSFPIEEDDHLLTVLRYVERNALRANLVERVEQWRWSSLWHREHGNLDVILDEGPVSLPRDWRRYVQRPETEAELMALRQSVIRGSPFGHGSWNNEP
jgi:putative transposase